MTSPRSQQIDLSATPYYHVVSRCVRRAFLCGDDALSQRNFDHRRGWLVERFRRLCDVFAIDVAAFACMSNHYHLVLCVDRERADRWHDKEVTRRWRMLCSGATDQPSAEQIAAWRVRLHDISWFMKLLNEYISRRANSEDDCKGRFCESRFKSQALLDTKALLSAMAYVDLNPIRAQVADTLLASDYTSIQERIVTHARSTHSRPTVAKQKLAWDASTLPPLLPFTSSRTVNTKTPSMRGPLPGSFEDYVALVEWTGRQQRKTKRGFIPPNAPRALTQLSIDTRDWLDTMQRLRGGFASAVGDLTALTTWCEQRGRRWVKGMGRRTSSRAVANT